MEVEITGESYIKCDNASKNYWANSKPGAYGKGLGNTKGDLYKVTRTGLLGQMAFAKIFNLPVDLEYREGGDQYDNKIGDETYDIKCAMRNYGEGLIYHTDEWGKKQPLNKDKYVFAYIKSENRYQQKAVVVLVGYLNKEDVVNCEVKKGYKGKGHLNYVVPFNNLKVITELFHEIL